MHSLTVLSCVGPRENIKTATPTLLWALLLLATGPDVQDAVRSETQEAIGSESLSALANRVKLPNSKEVICEVQRFGSIVPIALIHVASQNTLALGLTSIPLLVHSICRTVKGKGVAWFKWLGALA